MGGKEGGGGMGDRLLCSVQMHGVISSGIEI